MIKNKILLINDALSIISLIFLIIPTIVLWWLIGGTPNIKFITILVGVIVLIDISTLITNYFSKKRIMESVPLMKYRMNKFLVNSIFFFGIGLPLLIEVWQKGLQRNVPQFIISILFLFVGLLMYEIGYQRRDKIIEKELIKENRRNKK